MLSLDTETTGLDPWHGSKPFLVTMFDGEENSYWEWDVDPLTREPRIPKSDIREIQEVIDDEDLIMHNAKFDIRMLETIGIQVDWERTHDTILLAHLINSSFPKDLESLVLRYLGLDVKEYDKANKQIVEAARRLCRRDYPDWCIASHDDPTMPSAKGTLWKFDLWLPRALAIDQDWPEDYEGWYATAEYANVDSASTYHLFLELERIVKERDHWQLYEARRKVLPIIHEMEAVGVSLSGKRLDKQVKEYQTHSTKMAKKCVEIARSYDYDLTLPKSGNNGSLSEFLFDVMEVPVVAKSKKTGNPSLDKSVMATYLETLEGKPLEFVSCLTAKRKRDTAVSYMESYEKFMLPIEEVEDFHWYRLHPSVNMTGTNTLRSSSRNPNEQNISKKEGFNLRYAFGPAPGREWWSLDYENLELRIPAYECQEPAMLKLFEHPNDPPFYGSYHLLIFSILYPDIFKKHGAKVKSLYRDTLYQWTKNGNFAELYGAVDTGDGKSTADRAFHFPGAQAIVSKRLNEKTKLNLKYIEFANKHGYVETLPDKTVDPLHGYPLYIADTYGRGRVSPTRPLNYHVQGTACWVKCQAMVKCHKYLKKYPDYHIIMDIHDELVFDFPRKPRKGNMPKVRKIKQLMESCGDDVGVPLTVGVDYHPNDWSETK